MKSHKRVTHSDVLNWTKEAKLDLPDRWERIQYNLPQHPKQNIAENDIGLKSIYPKMSRKKLLIACAVFAVLILIGGLLVSGQSGLWFQPSNNSDNHTYMHHAKLFGYFGVFSGAVAGGPHFTLAGPDLYQAVLMVGCGEEDMAYNNSDIGLIKFQNELRAAQIPFTPYFVTGAHDWFAWPQLFAHFAGAVLWR